jgi:hypothetical protein
VNGSPSHRERNRLPLQPMRMKRNDMQQKDELKDEVRAQASFDHQKTKTGARHSVAHIAVLSFSNHTAASPAEL